ncbi:MAG TPA: amino acid permease [Rhodanobacteraceae bacterium]|jgi:amino acid transporter|nr:amino acid permease [Rhodanobacteraceae bacterium]
MTVSTATPRRELPRKLGLVTGMAVVVGVIIGSGIFRVPSGIAADTGNLTGIALVWILGGIVALFGALSIAELAAMYPAAGGPYVYLREAYGKPLAFLFGWMWLLTTPISWAAQSLMFAEYLGFFMPIPVPMQHVIAAVLIVLVAAANVRSVKLGAAIQNLSAGAKVLAIVGLSAAIFFLAPGGAANPLNAEPMGMAKWSGIGIGLIAVLWAYDGWQNLTTLSGEVKNPQRNLPLALIGGVLVVIVVYMLINAAYLRALSVPQLAASKSVATDAATVVLGRAGVSLIGALVMLSVFGTLNGSILSSPRVFFAMAEDGLFFRTVGKVHPKYETPYVAIGFIVVIAVIYVLLRDFMQLAEGYVLGVWPFLALCVIGIFILRRTRPDFPRQYRTLGYPVVPALFVLATFVVVANALYAQFWSTIASVLITLAGVPLYFLWMRWQRRVQPQRNDPP